MKLASCFRCKITIEVTAITRRAQCPCCKRAIPQRNLWESEET